MFWYSLCINIFLCWFSYFIETLNRHGKSFNLSSSGKFRAVQCPQNSMIHDKWWPEMCKLNVAVAWLIPQILIFPPQYTALHFSILNFLFFYLKPPLSNINSMYVFFKWFYLLLRGVLNKFWREFQGWDSLSLAILC